jgi:hypothetical protein
MNDAIATAEQDLQRIAIQRREQHAQSPKAALEMLSAFRAEMLAAQKETHESVQTVTKTVDPQGRIKVSVGRGISAEVGALVSSNMRSRKERGEAIRLMIKAVDEAISELKAGGAVPADLEKHLQAARESIPDRNEMELISKPKDEAAQAASVSRVSRVNNVQMPRSGPITARPTHGRGE